MDLTFLERCDGLRELSVLFRQSGGAVTATPSATGGEHHPLDIMPTPPLTRKHNLRKNTSKNCKICNNSLEVALRNIVRVVFIIHISDIFRISGLL